MIWKVLTYGWHAALIWVASALAAAGLAIPYLVHLSGISTPGPHSDGDEAQRSASASLHIPLVLRAWSGSERPPGSGLLITEVMYDPDSDEPAGEWIEVFNPGAVRIDLSLYKIGDEEVAGGGEGMYRFPTGADLLPGEVILIANQGFAFKAVHGFAPDYELRDTLPDVPDLLRHAAWAGGNVELVNTGDDVLILGEQDMLIDAVSWGSASFAFQPPAPDVPPGHSLERKPANRDTDSAGDWIDQDRPSPGVVDLRTPTPTATPTVTATPTPSKTPTSTASQTATPGPSPTGTGTATPVGTWLLISEVVYDPSGEEPDGEWVEIYLPGSAAISLEGYKVGDEETMGGGEGMYAFPDGASMSPGQVLVLANQSTFFRSIYGFSPDYEFNDTDPAVPDMVKYTAWSGGNITLGNSGDEVLLIDPGDQPVDALSWGTSTFAFDPSAPDVAEGHSLERRPADHDTNSAEDWIDQPVPQPGQVNLIDLTPGPTPSQTHQPSPTPSPSQTHQPTPTPLPSQTHQPTPTPSPSQTHQSTPTPSPSQTHQSSPTPPPSQTHQPTPTPLPSQTHQPTPTWSPTPSMTPSQSATSTPAPTSTQVGTPVPVAHLLIAEVYYDTSGVDADEEWIEIYNPLAVSVDLSGYKLGDEETPGGGEGMVRFPPGTMIGAGERLVVALRAMGFRALFNLDPDFEIFDSDPGIPDMLPYPDWAGGNVGLVNSGDEILLLDDADQPVDVVTYESGSFPGVIPHPGVATGHSIERVPVDQDTDDCSVDFIDQPDPTPGS